VPLFVDEYRRNRTTGSFILIDEGTNATVGLLDQEPALDPDKDVRGNVEDGVAGIRALLDRFNELSMNYSDETADEFSRVQEQIDAADAWNLDTTLEYAMDALRCPPADAEVTNLSGGERRRVAMCRLLLRQPDLLLLDEPTNGMDLEAERAIMELLLGLQVEQSTTIVFVTHLLSAIEHFARRVALITRDGTVVIGAKEQMLAPDNIARAYAANET